MTNYTTIGAALCAAALLGGTPSAETAPAFPLIINGEICELATGYCGPLELTLYESGLVEAGYGYAAYGGWTYSGSRNLLRMDFGVAGILQGKRFESCFEGMVSLPGYGIVGEWYGCML